MRIIRLQKHFLFESQKQFFLNCHFLSIIVGFNNFEKNYRLNGSHEAKPLPLVFAEKNGFLSDEGSSTSVTLLEHVKLWYIVGDLIL